MCNIYLKLNTQCTKEIEELTVVSVVRRLNFVKKLEFLLFCGFSMKCIERSLFFIIGNRCTNECE